MSGMKNRKREAEKLLHWIIDSLRGEKNADQLEGILRTLAVAEAENERIVLLVEHEFTRDWIREHLLEGMTAKFREMTRNPTLAVELRIGRVRSSGDEEKEAEAVSPAARKAAAAAPRLNPKYVFESFVVSATNRFAHATSLAVAKAPGAAYNPLFIYGGVGLGKTHLLQAIGHHIAQKGGGNVLYVTCEEFLNEMIDALGSGPERLKRFRRKFRGGDCLLIDDIQFLAGKEQTQEEFFNTFNELHNASRQIVMTSDRPPHEIQRVEKRLISRFESGMVADIQPPDYELRLAILKKQAGAQKFPAEDGILSYLAKKVTLNIRQLEGALIRLIGHVRVFHKSVTTALVDEVLGETAPAPAKRVSVESIVKATAHYYGLPVDELTGKRRTKGIVRPRQVAMFIARSITGATLDEIGDAFGGKDHTTVLYAVGKIDEERKADPALRADLEEIKKRLEE